MNKAELISRLEPFLGGRRSASEAIDLVVDAIIREVAAGGSVTITGFGTFERAERAARTGRNPRTGEEVPIAATVAPRFRPGTLFREVVSDPQLIQSDALIGGRAPAGTAGTGQVGAGRMPTGNPPAVGAELAESTSGLAMPADDRPGASEPGKTQESKSERRSKGDKKSKSDQGSKSDKKTKKKSKKKNK